jgi:chromosome segregation ATPase
MKRGTTIWLAGVWMLAGALAWGQQPAAAPAFEDMDVAQLKKALDETLGRTRGVMKKKNAIVAEIRRLPDVRELAAALERAKRGYQSAYHGNSGLGLTRQMLENAQEELDKAYQKALAENADGKEVVAKLLDAKSELSVTTDSMREAGKQVQALQGSAQESVKRTVEKLQARMADLRQQIRELTQQLAPLRSKVDGDQRVVRAKEQVKLAEENYGSMAKDYPEIAQARLAEEQAAKALDDVVQAKWIADFKEKGAVVDAELRRIETERAQIEEWLRRKQ